MSMQTRQSSRIFERRFAHAATISKLIKDTLAGKDMRMAGDTTEMIVDCCTGMKEKSHPFDPNRWHVSCLCHRGVF